MRVLQIVKTSIGANWAFDQAKWLHDHGIDIITVLPSIDEGLALKYISNDMPVIKGDFSLPTREPWLIKERVNQIRKTIEKINPDIIHCHFVTNIFVLRIALRNSRIPRIFQVPGPFHLENELIKRIELWTSKSNDYWVATCKKTYEIYRKAGVPNEKLFLSYYGGYGGKACDEYKEKSNIIHNQFNLSDDKILVGMVSYFYRPKHYLLQIKGIKGHEDFIDAIAIVRKRNEHIIGLIIGDSWGDSENYVIKIKRYADKICPNGIIFTGFRNDLKDIYRELDIAVHPSHSENLGGAAESLAAGVPTISTSVGGFPDIVIDNVTGYVVNPKNPKEIADAIEKTIRYPKETKCMAHEGQKNVASLLDINHTSAKMKEIYISILSDK